MGLGKDLSYAYKALVFLIAFGTVAYAMVFFGDYLAKFRDMFFITGNWEWAAYILIFVFALSWLLKKLLKWEFRAQTGLNKKPKRRR